MRSQPDLSLPSPSLWDRSREHCPTCLREILSSAHIVRFHWFYSWLKYMYNKTYPLLFSVVDGTGLHLFYLEYTSWASSTHPMAILTEKIHNNWGGQFWWLMYSELPTSELPPKRAILRWAIVRVIRIHARSVALSMLWKLPLHKSRLGANCKWNTKKHYCKNALLCLPTCQSLASTGLSSTPKGYSLLYNHPPSSLAPV